MAVTLVNFWIYSSSLITCSLVLTFFKQLGAECTLTLTPSLATFICPGDQLMLTCNTSANLQKWTIQDSNTGMSHTRTIAVPTTSRAAITPLEVQSFTFSFAVISASNTLPLISTLTVNGVADYLNTSRISCLEIDTGNSEMVNVHILEPNAALEGVHVDYHLVGPWFGINNATVIIQLNESSQENDYHGLLVSYLNITPPSKVELQTHERARFQLEVTYNTQVNVSIIASLCGQHHVLSIIQILYTNCGHPPVQQLNNVEMSDGPLMVNGDIHDMIPVMEGFNVGFSCRFEFMLSGPNSSTCMRNGKWEPNPEEVECRQKANCGSPSTPQYGYVHPFTSTLEGEEVLFSCSKPDQESLFNFTSVCSDNGIWSPNPRFICAKHSNQSGIEESTGIGDDIVLVGITASSVTFALTTVICFIIGLISGLVGANFTKCAKLSRGESVNSNITNHNLTTNPVYDNIMPQEMRPQQNNLELQENVAYY